MGKPRMNVSLGGAGAVLTLLPGSGGEGAIDLTPDQLLELIHALGLVRGRLLADQTSELDTRAIQAVVAPAWTVRPEALTEGSMLVFAHPSYGTVGFVLAATEVQRMVRALTSHLGMVHSSETEMSKN